VGGEAFLQLVDAVHQGFGKLEQDFALGGQLEVGAAPFEQHHGQFPFQGLDLQGHRGLGQEQLVRRLGDAAAANHLVERPQLLEPVVLVIKRGIGWHGSLL
jgi:hypothetical protein